MDQTMKPRATKTVFDRVREKQGVPEEAKLPPVQPAEKSSRRFELTEFTAAAAEREQRRFAALAGVLGIHLLTGFVTLPVTLVGMKIVADLGISALGLAMTFTWFQAALLSGGVSLAGPLVFFLYRYWSGRY